MPGKRGRVQHSAASDSSSSISKDESPTRESSVREEECFISLSKDESSESEFNGGECNEVCSAMVEEWMRGCWMAHDQLFGGVTTYVLGTT